MLIQNVTTVLDVPSQYGAEFLPTWGFIIPHVSTLLDNKSECIWPWRQGNKSFCLNLPGAHSGESSFHDESVSSWRWVNGNAQVVGEGLRPPLKRPALSHWAHSSLIRRLLLSSQCNSNTLVDPGLKKKIWATSSVPDHLWPPKIFNSVLNCQVL